MKVRRGGVFFFLSFGFLPKTEALACLLWAGFLFSAYETGISETIDDAEFHFLR